MEQITARLMSITPSKAKELLIGNHINRKISQARVAGYARQMENGEWRANGESIIIGDDGTLLDGQHRLLAVVMSGHPIDCIVTFGVKTAAFDTINTGDKRTASDVIGISGYKPSESGVIAKCVRQSIIFNEKKSLSNGGMSARILTPRVILDEMKSDKDNYVSASDFALSLDRRAFPLARGLVAFLVYRFRKAQLVGMDSDEWLMDLINGTNISNDDPRLWIRTRLLAARVNRSPYKTEFKLQIIIKAWYIKMLGIPAPTGSSRESNFMTDSHVNKALVTISSNRNSN